MRRIPPAEERMIRQNVIREASAMMRSLALEAYIRGEYGMHPGAGRAAYGIERAVIDHIEKSNGRGRMALIAEMVAIRGKKLSTTPPEMAGAEPIVEDIMIR